ncbi:MAG: hypothetical protein QM765_08990 [Myxococcales bacterium]
MPPMRQPLPHTPFWQISPPPQGVALATGAWAQVPAPSHLSVVQALPSSGQLVAAEALDQSVADLETSQSWQALAGLAAPAARKAPAMRHPASQVPASQYWPEPQALSSAAAACSQLPAPSQASPVQGLPSSAQAPPAPTWDQAVALAAGSQRWQALAGLGS